MPFFSLGSPNYQCRICDQRFLTYDEYLKHLTHFHIELQPIVYKCATCCIEFSDSNEFKMHIKSPQHIDGLVNQQEPPGMAMSPEMTMSPGMFSGISFSSLYD